MIRVDISTLHDICAGVAAFQQWSEDVEEAEFCRHFSYWIMFENDPLDWWASQDTDTQFKVIQLALEKHYERRAGK